MTCLYTIVAVIALAQGSGKESSWVSMDQNEGACVLRDFGERCDGGQNGVRVWFGRQMLLACSFYVASESWNHHQNAIYAGGMFYGEHEPLHYCYNVAFFDAQENLIACAGGDLPHTPPVKGGGATSVTRLMPVPKGVHQSIHSYKTAYYESNQPIGKVAWDEHKKFTVTSTNGDTGKTTKESWPLWKSDGELRGAAFRVRTGSRPLPIADNQEWRAQTREGMCSLNVPTSSNSSNEQRQEVQMAPGGRLKVKATFRCHINQDSAIETWMSFENPSDTKMFARLYVAYFDKYENLVGSTNGRAKMEPHGTDPSFTINGKPQPGAEVFCEFMPVPIPVGLAEKVSSYKATLYESERPIGGGIDER